MNCSTNTAQTISKRKEEDTKMHRKKNRLASAFLAMLLSIALIPFSVFAEGLPENGEQNDDQIVNEMQLESDVQADDAQDEVSVPEGSGEETAAPASEETVPAVAPAASADDEQEVVTKDSPDCDHIQYLERVLKVPATCMAPGTKEHYHCTNCGALFLDSAAQQETTEAALAIPIDPNAHNWDNGTITTPATSSNAGVKTFNCKNGCGSKKTAIVPYKTTKSLTLDSKKLQFKTAVATPVLPEMSSNNAKVDHVWLTAGKSYITVYWNNPKSMTNADGVIILRKTGKEKVYKEVGRVSIKNEAAGKKHQFKDKKAKKKNTPYTYIAVVYCVKDGNTYISHCSDWAGGQTSASKLKSTYKAKINKKSASLQYGGKVTLKVKYSKPKKTYKSKSFRWYSDNTKVATVSKGKVTAKGPGTTTIHCRLACGKDVTCKVTVVGAFKPVAPTLKVDVADTSSITLVWSKSKYAKDYILHRSDDGLHWTHTYTVKGTSKKVTGLSKGHRYTFYVEARNTNGPYTATSKNSNVVYQKAVEKLRETKVTSWPSTKSAKAGNTLKFTIKVTAPESRKASLQMKNGNKWTTKKTITLPKGTGTSKCTITLPKDWWNGKTHWRLVIPKNHTATAYTTGTLTVTAQRKYQNPSKYVQISNSISKHGYSYYVSPVLVNSTSTRSDHVEALIKTANKYKGTRYAQSKSGAPGKGIDESGLVMQACYGAGVDLWPVSPATRPYNCVPKIRDSALGKISNPGQTDSANPNNYVNLYRGDLVFFSTSKGGTPIHVAIYTGLGGIIHADPIKGSVGNSTIAKLTDPDGDYRYYIVAGRRIFN